MLFHSNALQLSMPVVGLRGQPAPIILLKDYNRPVGRYRHAIPRSHPFVSDIFSSLENDFGLDMPDTFSLLRPRLNSGSSFFDQEFKNMRQLMMSSPSSHLHRKDLFAYLDQENVKKNIGIIRSEDEKSYSIQLDVPENLNPDNIELKVHPQGNRHYLSLSGVVENKSENSEDSTGYKFTSKTTFSSKVLLPQDADVETLKADFLSASKSLSENNERDVKNENKIEDKKKRHLMVKVSKVVAKGDTEESEGRLIEIGEEKSDKKIESKEEDSGLSEGYIYDEKKSEASTEKCLYKPAEGSVE